MVTLSTHDPILVLIRPGNRIREGFKNSKTSKYFKVMDGFVSNFIYKYANNKNSYQLYIIKYKG